MTDERRQGLTSKRRKGPTRLNHEDVLDMFRMALYIVDAGSERVEDALLLRKLAVWLVDRGYVSRLNGKEIRSHLEYWSGRTTREIREEYLDGVK